MEPKPELRMDCMVRMITLVGLVAEMMLDFCGRARACEHIEVSRRERILHWRWLLEVVVLEHVVTVVDPAITKLRTCVESILSSNVRTGAVRREGCF